MNNHESIKQALRADYQRFKSLTKLEFETGVSKAYLSQILNDKLNPSEAIWAKLENHYRFARLGYRYIETANQTKALAQMKFAQAHKLLSCVIGNGGTGKSTAAREYARQHENVFYVEGSSNVPVRLFLENVAKALYLQVAGNKAVLIAAIREKLANTRHAVLLIDEASELNDSCLLTIKQLYGDHTTAQAGIVLLGTAYLEENLNKQARKNKRGFVELLDRISFPFVHLKEADANEALQMCTINGVTNQIFIEHAVMRAKATGSYRGVDEAITYQKQANQ